MVRLVVTASNGSRVRGACIVGFDELTLKERLQMFYQYQTHSVYEGLGENLLQQCVCAVV